MTSASLIPNNYLTVNIEDQPEPIRVTSFHVSCRSDRYTQNEDMTGIILYQYQGKTEWIHNNIKCKPGYIYICNNKNLQYQQIKSMYLQCYERLFGSNSDYTTIIATGIKFDKTKKEWTSSNSAIKLLNNNNNEQKNNNDDNKAYENEKIWFDILINRWRKSGYKEQTVQIQPVWSWWKGKWMHYDVDTLKYIEQEFADFHLKNDKKTQDEVSIKLTDPNNKSKIFNNSKEDKVYNTYKIYFKTSKINLKADKTHSRQNPNWKNDIDITNSYYYQENYKMNKFRIVRRRIMS